MRAALLGVLACGCGRLAFEVERPIDDVPALTLSYPQAAVAAVLGVTQIALAPTVSDPAARFAIQPSLPAGLTLDPASGELAGTPSQISDGIVHTIVATTATDSASYAIELVVLPGFVVTTTEDLADADAGVDATCGTASGACSLRAAIQTANNRPRKQLVLLAAARYPLGAALDPIARDVVIAGRGAQTTTIAAATPQAPYPALRLATAVTLALRDLELREFGGKDGGALQVTAGTLDVDGCAFTKNLSPGSGGALFIEGGARATLTRTMFHGNASLGGNGGGWGGAIDGEGAGTTIVVRQSAATLNRAAWGAFAHITTGTALRLESSTLYGNLSTTAGTLASPGGGYTLVNATIVNNTNTSATPSSAGLYLYSDPATYVVTNTLVAANRDVNGRELNCERRDLTTVVTSGGGNLFSDRAGNCAAAFTAPGDQLLVDPLLDPAGALDHGGPTPTVVVQRRSPAINGGNDEACPTLDQRGVKRPWGAHCDVGAVELP